METPVFQTPLQTILQETLLAEVCAEVFNDVRAVLGLNDIELDDATLSVPVVGLSLQAELRDVARRLPQDLAACRASPPAQRSEVQTQFLAGVHLFATYSVAMQLCAALPLMAPKEVSDGKAAVVRFAGSPYEVTSAHIKEQWGRWRVHLEAAHAAYVAHQAGGQASFEPAARTARVYVLAVAPAHDPVTGGAR